MVASHYMCIHNYSDMFFPLLQISLFSIQYIQHPSVRQSLQISDFRKKAGLLWASATFRNMGHEGEVYRKLSMCIVNLVFLTYFVKRSFQKSTSSADLCDVISLGNFDLNDFQKFYIYIYVCKVIYIYMHVCAYIYTWMYLLYVLHDWPWKHCEPLEILVVARNDPMSRPCGGICDNFSARTMCGTPEYLATRTPR